MRIGIIPGKSGGCPSSSCPEAYVHLECHLGLQHQHLLPGLGRHLAGRQGALRNHYMVAHHDVAKHGELQGRAGARSGRKVLGQFDSDGCAIPNDDRLRGHVGRRRRARGGRRRRDCRGHRHRGAGLRRKGNGDAGRSLRAVVVEASRMA